MAGDLAQFVALTDSLILEALEINFGRTAATARWLRDQGYTITAVELQRRIDATVALQAQQSESAQWVLDQAFGALVAISTGRAAGSDVRDHLAASAKLLDLEQRRQEAKSGVTKDNVYVSLGPSFSNAEEWSEAFASVIEESRNRPTGPVVND